MKHINNIIFAFIALSTVACKSTNAVPPSQNKALNSISKSNGETKRKGFLQESLDANINNSTDENKDKEKVDDSKEKILINEESKESKKTTQDIKTQEVEDTKHEYTMQYYFDKAVDYMSSKPKTTSHVEEMNSMPVIGK
jgi:hypothetical protein